VCSIKVDHAKGVQRRRTLIWVSLSVELPPRSRVSVSCLGICVQQQHRNSRVPSVWIKLHTIMTVKVPIFENFGEVLLSVLRRSHGKVGILSPRKQIILRGGRTLTRLIGRDCNNGCVLHQPELVRPPSSPCLS